MNAEKPNIDDLYEQLSELIDSHPGSARTMALAEQLATALRHHASDFGAIFAEECHAIVAEARGDLQGAIRHREEEIRLISHLHQISRGTPGEDLVFGQYDFSDLSDRLELLAILYHDFGDLDAALQNLCAAKQLCLANAIPFEADDVLGEYLEERPNRTHDLSVALSVSENGRLLTREVETRPRIAMPSSLGVEIEQTPETANSSRRMPIGAPAAFID